MATAVTNRHGSTSRTDSVANDEIAWVAALSARVVVDYVITYLFKELMYNSILAGAAWVPELLDGHKWQFCKALGMTKAVFLQLCHELHMGCEL